MYEEQNVLYGISDHVIYGSKLKLKLQKKVFFVFIYLRTHFWFNWKIDLSVNILKGGEMGFVCK